MSSSGRLFQILEPDVTSEWSLTVAGNDRRTSRRPVVQRWPLIRKSV